MKAFSCVTETCLVEGGNTLACTAGMKSMEIQRREYTRGSGCMLPREILKFSFSKMQVLRILKEI